MCENIAHARYELEKEIWMSWSLIILPSWENLDPERFLCNRDLSKRIKFTDLKKKEKESGSSLENIGERMFSTKLSMLSKKKKKKKKKKYCACS